MSHKPLCQEFNIDRSANSSQPTFMQLTDDPRYPIGRHEPPKAPTAEHLTGFIEQLAAFPQDLRNTVARLSDSQIQSKTLPGVWTVAQVIHHLADSHMNAF